MELPVVLSATRLYQPIEEAPSAVTIITREMIEASAVRDIPDLLRLVPGFVVGMPNSFRVATSQHGLTSSLSRRMQVLVDGRSINSPVFGGVLWYDLPLVIDDIERIEVVRGPNAASFGSSAFFGVINITTRHAAEDSGFRSKIRYGNNDIRDGFLRYGAGTGAMDWRLSLQYQQDDGMKGPENSRVIKLASARGDYQLDSRNNLLLQGGYNTSPREIDSLNPEVPPRQQEAKSFFTQARWEHSKTDGSSFWLQAYHSRYDVDQDFSYVFSTLPGSPSDEDPLKISAQRTDIEFEDTQILADRLRLVWGGGLRLDRIESAVAFGTPDPIDMHYRRLFANAEWRSDSQWIVNLGTMYENHDFTGNAFSPRFAINYRLSPNHVLRAGIERATRIPVAYEETANLIFAVDTQTGTVINEAYTSSGGLDAETITSREIGYVGHFLDGRLDVDARIYHERLSNLIARQTILAADYNGFAFDYAGVDKADVRGSEIQLDYKLSHKHFYRLAYGYTTIDSEDIAQPLTASAPQDLLTLFGTAPLRRSLQGTATYYYSSGHTFLTDFDGGMGGDPLDPYHRLDLRLSHPLRHIKGNNEIALVVQSAFGAYHNYHDDHEFQRRIWLELKLSPSRAE